jgi:hypothetical protein
MHSLNRSFLTLCFVCASLLIALASCAKKETTTSAEPSAAAPAASAPADTASVAAAAIPASAPSVAVAPAGIATADGETAGVTATVKELKRASGGTISLKLVITNGSDKQLDTGYAFVDPDNEVRDFNSIGGVQLIDPVGKKKYFVARDAEKKCVCSQGIKGIEPGASINVWAKFPAPPLDVQKISVIIPHFSPMDDVPISGE